MRERVPTLGVGNCEDEANQWAFDLAQAAFSHKQRQNLRGSKHLSGSETNLQKRRDRSDRMLYRSGQRGQKQDYDCKFPNWSTHDYRCILEVLYGSSSRFSGARF
jgi:hypothetical protein